MMKVIDDDYTPEVNKKDCTRSRNLYMGSLLVLFGIWWLLYNLDMIDMQTFNAVFRWETLLVVFGGYFMSVRKMFLGAGCVLVGVLFWFASHWDIHIPVGEIIMPAILIAAGIAILIPKRG